MFVRHARLDIAEKYLDPKSEDVVLSVGCKRGELERALVAKVKEVHATDIEDPTGDEDAHSNDGIQFTISDVTKGLPYPDNTFDKVLFLEVIEHVPSGTEHKALQEIYRVLKPGGRLAFSTPNKHPVSCAMDPAYWLEGHRHYRPTTIQNMMESCGFTVNDLQVNGAWRESFLLPVYYLAIRTGMKKLSHNWIHNQINKEYSKKGWYTISVCATKL
jgi:ubiquinone/menaquinone biosynthesis C-methylase UbiE